MHEGYNFALWFMSLEPQGISSTVTVELPPQATISSSKFDNINHWMLFTTSSLQHLQSFKDHQKPYTLA